MRGNPGIASCLLQGVVRSFVGGTFREAERHSSGPVNRGETPTRWSRSTVCMPVESHAIRIWETGRHPGDVAVRICVGTERETRSETPSRAGRSMARTEVVAVGGGFARWACGNPGVPPGVHRRRLPARRGSGRGRTAGSRRARPFGPASTKNGPPPVKGAGRSLRTGRSRLRLSSRSTARTRADADAGGSGRSPSCACARSSSR